MGKNVIRWYTDGTYWLEMSICLCGHTAGCSLSGLSVQQSCNSPVTEASLSQRTHTCLLWFISFTPNNKRALCVCPRMCWSLHYAFVSVTKRCPPGIISVTLRLLMFFYRCIILWNIDLLWLRHLSHVAFVVHQQICIDREDAARLARCCLVPVCPPRNRLYLTTCVTVSSLSSSCLPSSLWWETFRLCLALLSVCLLWPHGTFPRNVFDEGELSVSTLPC